MRNYDVIENNNQGYLLSAKKGGFIDGYNERTKTHPYSKQDILDAIKYAKSKNVDIFNQPYKIFDMLDKKKNNISEIEFEENDGKLTIKKVTYEL